MLIPNSLLLIEDDWGEGVHAERIEWEDGREAKKWKRRKGTQERKEDVKRRGEVSEENGLKDKGSGGKSTQEGKPAGKDGERKKGSFKDKKREKEKE